MSEMDQGQAEVEVVTGVVIGVIDKGGDKWQVSVKTDPNSQYSRNLWTKDGDLVYQVRQMIGAQMQFHCGVSHWTNQSNQPVRSLWINGMAPLHQGHSVGVPQQQPGTQAVAQAMYPPQMAQPQQVHVQPQAQPMAAMAQADRDAAGSAWGAQSYDDDPKQGKIHRQTASKVAAILLGYLPAEERTLDTLLTVSQRLVGYYDNGMETVVSANDDGMDPHTGEFPPEWG